MGKPAATLGHFHICPQYRGDTPHVGGPVAGGSGDVTIGGMPAARVGDKLVCNAPPDTIKQGSASVFINGKPAARMGDSTEHGGVIVAGNATVLIGDQTYSSNGGSASNGKVQALARRQLSRVMVCQKDGQPTICVEPNCPCKEAAK
ncbi:PAAR domain-containing protein [Pokkaliibacter plantistimulans]|uniref:PAAR domain-containing protein n=1 Tax=Pokkaliibacter plantistimulans TaxID=1635171 RepID=UPI000D746BB7|nr:PAAR domain-containing protein [Pokkaliibacter plantistimulans]